MNLAYDYYKSTVSDDEMRERLEAREKYEMDQISRLDNAKEEGREEGRDDLMRTMLRNGIPAEQIAAMNNVAVEVIESMEQKNRKGLFGEPHGGIWGSCFVPLPGWAPVGDRPPLGTVRDH